MIMIEPTHHTLSMADETGYLDGAVKTQMIKRTAYEICVENPDIDPSEVELPQQTKISTRCQKSFDI
jgi:hypothetical protein